MNVDPPMAAHANAKVRLALGIVRRFAPNWFSATMGTGVLPFVLVQLPSVGHALRPLGELIWWFNLGLFLSFSLLYLCQWLMFYRAAVRILDDGTASMFLGTIPMGMATILNGAIGFALPRFGAGVVPIIEALWWLDVGLALVIGIGVPYLMFTRQRHSLEEMSAAWLLPVCAAEVVATTGGYLAPNLLDSAQQFLVLTTSYVLWAYSVPIAFCLLAVLLLRMALHKLPPVSVVASTWLALGPIGTGALDMLVLGSDAPAIFTANALPRLGAWAGDLGVLGAVLLWGSGLWWVVLATLVTARYFRSPVPFHLGWWGFTFPLGVYAVVTLRLANILHLDMLKYLGVVLSMALVAVWIIVTARTLNACREGHPLLPPSTLEDSRTTQHALHAIAAKRAQSASVSRDRKCRV